MADIWGEQGQLQAAIQPQGGGCIWTNEVNPATGASLTAGGNWSLGPIIEESTWKDAAPFEKYYSNDAITYYARGKREAGLEINTFQRNTEVLLAPHAGSGRAWSILIQLSNQLVNGQLQYVLFGYAMLEAVNEYKQYGNMTKLNFVVMPVISTLIYGAGSWGGFNSTRPPLSKALQTNTATVTINNTPEEFGGGTGAPMWALFTEIS